MAFTVIVPTTTSDSTPIGSHGAVVPGKSDSVISFPSQTGTVSLGSSQIASGIITLLPGSGSSSTGVATVSGLASTDVVITSFDSDASGSSQFFSKVDASAGTITSYGYTLNGGTYAKCHYVVFRP